MQGNLIGNILTEEYNYCILHLVYFVENYVYIENKDDPDLYVPFNLWKEQKDVLKQMRLSKLLIALKARQLGFTWLALSYAAWRMLKGGYSVIALSRSEEEAKELIRRLRVILEHLPFISRDGKKNKFKISNSNLMFIEIETENGLRSDIRAFASSQSVARSFTANLLILDEWAFQAWAREIWASAFPTVNRPTGGQVIGISTIARGTLFEDLWCDPNNGFKHVFLPWYTDPRRDAKWYADTKAAIGEDKMLQEYPATPDEALTILGGAFYPEFKQEIHITDDLPHTSNVRWYVALDYGLDMTSAGLFWIDDLGNARLHREINIPGLIVSAAAEEVAKLAKLASDKVYMYLAPPDLWNKRQETGRSAAEIFSECGISLTKAVNSFEDGCVDVHEWLKPIKRVNEQTGEEYDTALLTFDPSCVVTTSHIKKIQKDKNNPNIYAKDPHDLTHANDMIRYFCAGRPRATKVKEEKPKKLKDYLDKQVRKAKKYRRY